MKGLAGFLLCLLLLFSAPALADEWLDYPWDQETAPTWGAEACYTEDGYEDRSLKVRMEWIQVEETPVLLVRVKIADVRQFRTALSAPFPSRTTRYVPQMAQRVRAVLALNSDNFAYHTSGIVVRNREVLRMQPDRNRDTLIIDGEGNFRFLSPTTRKAYDTFEGEILHAFCFGPVLVDQGRMRDTWDLKIKDLAREKKLRRIAIGQTGEKEYIIIASQGPEDDPGYGLTLLQLARVCRDQGCRMAYNLDGGVSTSVVFRGEKINCKGSGRAVGDMIFFASIDRDALAMELGLEPDELLDIPDF